MIRHSQHVCELDIYELSDPDILQALISAHRRGVTVEVVVDATEPHSQQTGMPTLRHAGVPVESLAIHSGISHIKMLITDGPDGGVLIGGMNFGAGSWANNDASVYFTHPNSSYAALFHWDWERAGGKPAMEPVLQQPLVTDHNIDEAVVHAISTAHQSVAVEAFDLSDYAVVDALDAAVKRGVTVEVLLDPNEYPNQNAANTLRDDGVTVRFYSSYSGEWMHAKIVDVDHGTTFIIGSANFSHQAYTYNHEGDIVLHTVPKFDQALQSNLAVQISRGTDYPVKTASSTQGG